MCLWASIGLCKTIHVPVDQPTIQAGIDAAEAGDTVLVADGTYTGDGNKNLDFSGKAITVISESNPDYCFIDCEGVGRGFNFHSGEGESSVVSGFSIMNGYSQYGGGGVQCSFSSPTITNNAIVLNISTNGGGICCLESSSPVITNNLIAGNAGHQGGGIYCDSTSSPIIANNTITKNFVDYQGGGIMSINESSPAVVINTILWGDKQDELIEEIYGHVTVTYSDVQGGWEGEGNIDADPWFINPNEAKYGLRDYSPCIGAGMMTPDVPDRDYHGDPRPNPPGSNPDIGADENPLAAPRPVPKALVLWNTLGSDYELQNSEIGPSVMPLQTLAYAPAKYGNGVLSDNDDPVIRIPKSVLNTEEGTICLWMKLVSVEPYYPNATLHRFAFIENSSNLGFEFSANDGLAHSGWVGRIWGKYIVYSIDGFGHTSTASLGTNGENIFLSIRWNKNGVPGHGTEKFVLYRNDVKMSIYEELPDAQWLDEFSGDLILNTADYNPQYASGTVNLDLIYDDIQIYEASLSDQDIIDLYNAPVAPIGPTIFNIAPNYGYTIGGTKITITGENFQDDATVAIGGNFATDVTNPIATEASITSTPVDLTDDAPEDVELLITLDEGTGAITDTITFPTGGLSSIQFHVETASDVLRIIIQTAIDNTFGKDKITVSVNGPDTAVIVTFTVVAIGSGVRLTIEQLAGSDILFPAPITSFGGLTIHATTPAGNFGPTDVVVINPDGGTGILRNGFFYIHITGDVSGDGTVSAYDAALILQFVVGIIEQFPADSPISHAAQKYISGEITIEELDKILQELGYPSVLSLFRLENQLLQNYPNPFNPETWIPFKLAQDTPVIISIYDTKGQLIRTISLANRNAGIYTTKANAAYWDGRDSLGEKVASGIYYYTLQAGEFRATRKMLIVK